MKTNRWLAISLAGGLLFSGRPAAAHLEVDAAVEISAVAQFDEPLSPYGAWVEVPAYGRCWHPARVAVGWRPYCDGYWEWTDCGWCWVSDEPWAWACYHYGRWAYTPGFAWVWVPDTDWGSAWVCWREGGGYIGWAPLPPRFHGDVIRDADAPPSAFVFVEEGRFHDHHRPSTVVVNNLAVIHQTTNITRIKTEERRIASLGPRKVVVNEGPSVDQIRKATGRELRPAPIGEVIAQARPPAAAGRKAVPKRETAPAEKIAPPDKTLVPTPPPPNHEPPPPKRRDESPPARIVPPETGKPPENGVIHQPVAPVHPGKPAEPSENDRDRDRERGRGRDRGEDRQ